MEGYGLYDTCNADETDFSAYTLSKPLFFKEIFAMVV
jgi:hypothetical protein